MLQLCRKNKHIRILVEAIIISCFFNFIAAQGSSKLLTDSLISKSAGLQKENLTKIVTNDDYQDFQDLLDGADEGVIVFSEGSDIFNIFMSPDIRAIFLHVFSTFPQKVIWKTTMDESIGIPSNVIITRWLPQKALLAHPNVVCFILISYGGINDVQEAVFRGGPTILISMFQDQIYNKSLLEENGISAYLSIETLSEDTLSRTLKDILKHSRYHKNISEESKDISDNPDPFLPWYDIIILDVIGLLALVTVLMCKLIAKIIDIIRHLLIKNNENYLSIYQ